jgi:hypothetical protein
VSESRLFEFLTLIDAHSRHRLDKVASHIRLPKSIFNQRQKLSRSATAYYNTQSEIVRQPTTQLFLLSPLALSPALDKKHRRTTQKQHRDRALRNKRVLLLFQPVRCRSHRGNRHCDVRQQACSAVEEKSCVERRYGKCDTRRGQPDSI